MRAWLAWLVALALGCGGGSAAHVGVESGVAGSDGVAGGGDAGCEARSMDYDLMTGGGTLFGTLELPAGCETASVALIHAGSGPTDRDGNNPMAGTNDSLKLLAQGLAARGVASVRFDKRGIAASVAALTGGESSVTFDVFADDCAAWIEKLRADARFSRVTLVGHSEGSLIGMLAAQASPVDAFVSIAGPGRPANVVLREQLEKQLPPDLLADALGILERLERGETVDDVPAMLAALFRPSVQPYLISWFAIDPAVEIAALAGDVTIVAGTTDIQVPVSDAELLAAARPDAALSVIDGMSHVLKRATLATASQQAAYTDPSLPVMDELLEVVARVAAGH